MARLPKGVTRLKNGLYQLRFTYQGERYAVYGKSPAECSEKETEKRIRLKEGLADNQNITLARYYDEWQQGRRGTVKDSTIYTQNGRFEYVRKTLGKKKLQKIEKRDIVKLQKELAEELSTQTVNNIITLISTVMQTAYNDRVIGWNPCNGVKALKRTEPEATKTIHRALTEQEQILFFRYAADTYYNNFFRFLLRTGCRTGEAAALTWQDIDRKHNVIRITKTVSRIGNGTFEITEPKSKSSIRTIPLTVEVLEVLQQQKEIQFALHGNIINFDNRIFTTTNGKGYPVATNLIPCIKKILQKVETETGTHIEYFSPHAFRDTFATMAIKDGMSPKTLQTILGHGDISITMNLYVQPMEDVKQEEMQRISFVI